MAGCGRSGFLDTKLPPPRKETAMSECTRHGFRDNAVTVVSVDPACPYCEIERLTAENKVLRRMLHLGSWDEWVNEFDNGGSDE